MERLSISGLNKSFGQLHVTRDVSFSIAAGERVALIGPNGAGKTTLVNLVSGALPPSAGVIRFEGRDIQQASLADRARMGLIRTYQISRVFHDLTVAENLQVALLHKDRKATHLFAQPPKEAYRERVRAGLRQLQIESLAQRVVSTLSLGERRMVELALALVMAPKLLLLDEPAAGIPRGEAHLVLDAVNALPPDLAVVLIEHDMKIVFSWAQRVIVLAGGAVLADGPAADIANDPAVKRIYFGQGGESHAH